MKLQTQHNFILFLLAIIAPIISLVISGLLLSTNVNDAVAYRQLWMTGFQIAFQGYLIIVALVMVVLLWKIMMLLVKISNQLRVQTSG